MEKVKLNNDNLQQVVQERNITQAKLAELVGVRREYMSRIINRKANPSVPLASCIAMVLKVPIEDLFIIE